MNPSIQTTAGNPLSQPLDPSRFLQLMDRLDREPEIIPIGGTASGNPVESIIPAAISSPPPHLSVVRNDPEEQPIPFPMEALNASQQRAVAAVARAYRQDPALSGTVSIAGLSGAIGRLFKVEALPGRPTHANIFSLVVAPRSYGKSSASTIIAPITERENFIKKNYQEEEVPRLKVQIQLKKSELKTMMTSATPTPEAAGILTLEDRLTALQQQIDDTERKLLHKPALIVGSATGASLVGLMERNDCQLFSFNPEAGDLVRVALGRYTSDGRGDFDLLLSSYSVEPFGDSRVSRGTTYLEEPCMTLCWMAQPSLLQEILGSEDARGRGLLARFLWVSIEEGVIEIDDGTQVAIAPEEMDPWYGILRKALGMRLDGELPGSPEISCTDEAKAVFRLYHNETVALRNEKYREVQEELGRARENAIRLALGQCIADALEAGVRPTELTEDHARRGVALAQYFYDQFLRLLQPAQNTIRMKSFSKLEHICQSSAGVVTFRILKKNHGITEQEIERTVSLFPNRFSIEIAPASPNGGRPSKILRLTSLAGAG